MYLACQGLLKQTQADLLVAEGAGSVLVAEMTGLRAFEVSSGHIDARQGKKSMHDKRVDVGFHGDEVLPKRLRSLRPDEIDGCASDVVVHEDEV